MDIHDIPAVLPLREQPLRVAIEDLVVSHEGLPVLGEPRRQGPRPDRDRVEDGRGEVQDLRARRRRPLTQEPQAVLELREPPLVERVIDAVVHAVTGDDQIRLGLLQDAVEPFVQVGAGEGAPGVPRLGEPRDGLAGQAEVQELASERGVAEPQVGLDELDVLAAVRDAIAQEDDPANPRQGGGLGREGRCRADDQERERRDPRPDVASRTRAIAQCDASASGNGRIDGS